MVEVKLRPMLAAECEPARVRYPVIVQPKLDGIRAIIKEGQAFSRSMKTINNGYIQDCIRQFSEVMEGVDGELIVGEATADDVFRQTTSGVMSHHGTPDFRYHVFDLWNVPDAPYEQRLHALISRNLPDYCVLVQSVPVEDEASMLTAHEQFVAEGYEGTILRKPTAPYKYNRSTAKEGYLLKLKDFKDGEALIVDFEEKMHNANEAKLDERGFTKRSSEKAGMVPTGTLGAIVVQQLFRVEGQFVPADRLFRIGTGFDDELRRYIWANREDLRGKYAKFKYFEVGAYQVPRFPVFLGLRDRLDMEEPI